MTDDEKRAAMRALLEDQRRTMIEDSANVVGFGRFAARHRQVELRGAYRKPVAPGPGGRA